MDQCHLYELQKDWCCIMHSLEGCFWRSFSWIAMQMSGVNQSDYIPFICFFQPVTCFVLVKLTKPLIRSVPPLTLTLGWDQCRRGEKDWFRWTYERHSHLQPGVSNACHKIYYSPHQRDHAEHSWVIRIQYIGWWALTSPCTALQCVLASLFHLPPYLFCHIPADTLWHVGMPRNLHELYYTAPSLGLL